MPGLWVVVGMSGGVDSSVAAALLQQAGHQVTGVTMRTWAGEEAADGSRYRGCCGPGVDPGIRAAREAAKRLGIAHHVIDVVSAYRTFVLDYFRDEYLSAKTPNPCVRCNREVKFGALLRKARECGIEFERFATGHYARAESGQGRGRAFLRKGRDETKDQSYFLSALTQEQLRLCLFPVGEYAKLEVRRIARGMRLGVGQRPESQDFACGDYRAFLSAPPRPGPILDREGREVGRHEGIHGFTIGQRRGLHISARFPLYVIAIDAGRDAVIVGPEKDLLGDTLVAADLNWISIAPPDHPLQANARIRYRHTEAPARIEPLSRGRVRVSFREPQKAIAPGQAVVFYDGDLVLGGGTIESAG